LDQIAQGATGAPAPLTTHTEVVKSGTVCDVLLRRVTDRTRPTARTVQESAPAPAGKPAKLSIADLARMGQKQPPPRVVDEDGYDASSMLRQIRQRHPAAQAPQTRRPAQTVSESAATLRDTRKPLLGALKRLTGR
jgi:hypothetical protein